MSSWKMEVNRLKKDELKYELEIRGVSAADASVDALRAQLRSMLKLEASQNPLSSPEYNLDSVAELKILEGKLLELFKLVDSFEGTRENTRYVGIQSRLVHALKRTDRIPVASLGEEGTKTRSVYLAKFLELLDKLDAKPKTELSADVSRLYESPRGEEARTDSSSEEGEDGNVTTAIIPKSRSVPVHRWNLTFSGESNGLSVHNFLERVDELQQARNISDRELFEQALDLFEGKALLWYRANRVRFSDWKGLAKLLAQHYQPPDYKTRLFQDIMSRTQGPSESIVEYLACMTAMFKRYGKVSEDLKLDILIKNLAPFYMMQLPTVDSLQELETECLKLEVKKYRAENYSPPSHKKRDYVEPSLAYVHVGASTSNNELVNDMSVMNVGGTDVRPIERLCWKCNKSGHFARGCTASIGLKCFRCGQPNFTVKNCPKCSINSKFQAKNSGNGSRRRN